MNQHEMTWWKRLFLPFASLWNPLRLKNSSGSVIMDINAKRRSNATRREIDRDRLVNPRHRLVKADWWRPAGREK